MTDWLVIGFIVALGCVAVYLLFAIRRKKTNTGIPPEILLQFNEAERRYKEANGTKTRQDILYELASEHFGSKKPTTRVTNPYPQIGQDSEQRSGVPEQYNDPFGDDIGETRQVGEVGEQPKKDNGRNKPTRNFKPISLD